MKRHPRSLFRIALLSVLMTGMLLLLPESRAQIPSVDQKKGVPFAERQLFAELRAGKKVYDTDKKIVEDHRKAMTAMAQWMAYRLNAPPYNGEVDESAPVTKEPMPTDEKPIAKLMREAKESMIIPSVVKGASDDQLAFINEYGKALEKELVFVLKNASKPIVRVNAARMLAQTAQMPYLGLADALLNILKTDNELDAVKMYACEGLREIMLHNDRVEPKKAMIVDPKKQAEIATALIDYIMKTDPKAATDPEVARVVQFTRREGIRALAVFRDSVIRDPQKKMLAAPSLPLLRIAMCDPTLVPQPSLSEQVDALIGFCSMRIDADMDVGAAVRGIHVAMLDLTRKQNVDPENPGRERTLPWKIAGAKLVQAMATWKTLAEDIPVAQDPKLIYDYTRLISEAALSKFEESGLSARPDAAMLNQLRNQLEPKSKQLFKSDPTSSLVPGQPTAPKVEPKVETKVEPKVEPKKK